MKLERLIPGWHGCIVSLGGWYLPKGNGPFLADHGSPILNFIKLIIIIIIVVSLDEPTVQASVFGVLAGRLVFASLSDGQDIRDCWVAVRNFLLKFYKFINHNIHITIISLH